MTHLELENLVSDYLDGQLGADRRAAVDEHLAACAACRELVAGVRRAVALCRSAEDLEPAPWLVSRILIATTGERKPTLRDQIAAFLRPVLQPRTVYGFAVAVFSLSFVINAAGINLRSLTLQDLNPRNWVYQAKRNGHLLYGRAEKYCYDLRVVYEIESRLRQLRAQPDEAQPAPKQAPPGGSTHERRPANPQFASVGEPSVGGFETISLNLDLAWTPLTDAGRSTSR